MMSLGLSVSVSDVLTWLATIVITFIAYALGAMTYREGEKAVVGGAENPPPSSADVGTSSTSPGALETSKPAPKPAGDVERVSPPTPGPHRAVSPLGRQGSGEGAAELMEQEDRNEEEIVATGGPAVEATQDDATADSPGAELYAEPVRETPPSPPSSPRPTVRKIKPQPKSGFAVVQFRESELVRESGDEFESVKPTKAGKATKKKKKKKATQKEAGASRETSTTTPAVASMSLSKLRMTSDGIPVVDVWEGEAKELSSPVVKRKGSGNGDAYKSPSRTTSGSGNRTPLSPRASDYLPPLQKRAGVSGKAHVSQTGNRGVGAGAGGGGHGASTAYERAYGQRYSNPGHAWHVDTEYPAGRTQRPLSSKDTETSDRTWSNSSLSPAAPTHRPTESEINLEEAWMMASMTAADLGLGDSPESSRRMEDKRNNDNDTNDTNSMPAWQTPWGARSPASDLSHMLSQHHMSDSNRSNSGFTNTTNTTNNNAAMMDNNQDSSSYGLDLYSSLSSLSSMSWANSNSLSSFGSSVQRNPSAADERPDVFNTIKGIWGEPGEEEKVDQLTR